MFSMPWPVEMLTEKKKKPSFKDYPTRIDKLKVYVPVIQSMNVQKQYSYLHTIATYSGIISRKEFS